MKKKLLSAILCSAMIAGTLAGCGGSSDGGQTQAPAAEPATEEEAPAEDAAAEEEAEAPAASTDGEEVTLTVLAGQSTTDAGIEDMIDEALAAKYPNITLSGNAQVGTASSILRCSSICSPAFPTLSSARRRM